MSSLPPSETPCPSANDVEVSLFGPGYGESIAIHVGLGDWLVVDSCVNSEKIPAVLEYFAQIGVDAATAVKLIICTHWHDDHIRGMAKLYRACSSAVFVCSQALRNEDFFTLATAATNRPMMDSSGLDEFFGVLRALKERQTSPRWAIADRPLWQRNGKLVCSVQALSPADQAVTQALQSIGQLLEQGPSAKRRIPAPSLNHGAVATWLSVGSVSVLLGADLLHTTSPDSGWNAVIASPHRTKGQAKIYKVAHHGANSADGPAIWSSLLDSNPFAILTPFARGAKALPTSQDIKRLRKNTTHLYATARSANTRQDYGTGPVARTKREVLKSYRKIVLSPGQVRVRLDSSGSGGRVDLFGSALRL